MDTHSYLITTDSVTNFLRISTDINCSNLMLIESLIAPDNFIPYGYEIPIKSIGKNLLKNNCITSSVEGIDITVNNDGSITLDKTSSAVFTIDINTEFKLNVNKQYKFIYEGDTLPSGVFLSVRQKDSIQVIADLSANKVKNLDNIDQNINGIFRCYIYIPNGVTFDNITIKPMITLVENDNEYEAYEEYITKIYLKEPLCKIDNLMDIYDYQTNTILRMMVDNLAITKFIYVDHKGEMRLLRHYLFLLDGSLTYLKITDSMNSNVLIIEEREKCKREVQHTKEQIMKLSIYKIQHLYIDNLLSKGNWKFKNFSDAGNFSYQDLYKTFGIAPNIVAYFVYLSQFAHGLGLYSLGTVASIQNVPFLIEIRDMLLGMLINYIYGIFPEYVCNDGCLLESLRTKLSCDELERFFELTTNGNKSN